MTVIEWVTEKRDDTEHIVQAMREWNLRQPAHRPFLKFSDIPPSDQSSVLMRAHELSKGSQ